MDPLIRSLLERSPELQEDWDRHMAKQLAKGRPGNEMNEAAALAWAALDALRAGRDCRELLRQLEEILGEATVEDAMLIETVLDDLAMAMDDAEFEGLLKVIGPATREAIDQMLAPMGSMMRVAPNMPELISHLGPAKIAKGAPPEARPGSAAEIVGINIGHGGTGGKGIGADGRYTVKFGDGSTADVEERFVERPEPTN